MASIKSNDVERQLHQMEIHEQLTFGGGDPPRIVVTRVPNGWIYQLWNRYVSRYDTQVVHDIYIMKESIDRLNRTQQQKL